MFTGAAQRAGLTRLKPGAVIFQIFNRFFPLAERLQVEIVLVFVFVICFVLLVNKLISESGNFVCSL